MCIKPPAPRPLATAPMENDPSVLARQQVEAARLQAQAGTAATVKTDLDPKALTGKRIKLGA